MRLLFVAVLALMLGACASVPKPDSPEQAVFASKQAYKVALTTAVAYESLPRCVAPVRLPCSDTGVVRQLRAADNAAIVLLDAAEATVRSGGGAIGAAVTAAQYAVDAFTAVTKLFGGKQ